MLKRLNFALRLSTAALVLSGYMAMASLYAYGPAILTFPLLLFLLNPLGEYLDRHFAAYRTLANAAAVAYLCFIPFTVLVFGLLNAVVALVVFIQAYAMLRLKTTRHYYYLFLMSFFLLLAASVQQPEPVIGLVMLVFLVSAIWAFLTLRLKHEWERGRVRAFADIVQLDVARKQVPEAPQSPFDFGLIASVCLLSAQAVLLTAAVFLVTPRIEAGFLGRESDIVARTGLAQTVDLSDAGFLEQDQTAVMRVEFSEAPGGRSPAAERSGFYWRCTTYNQYSNARWSREPLRRHYEPGISQRFISEGGGVFGRSDVVRRPARPDENRVFQRVYVNDAPAQGLPCLSLVQRVELVDNPANSGIRWDEGNDFTVLYQVRDEVRRLVYEAWSEVGAPTPDTLRAQRTPPENFLHNRDYEVLLDHDLRPQTVELIERVAANAGTPYEKAVALENWLSGDQFIYTTNLPELPAANPLDAFLLGTRRGHCELFATGLALALRSQGIPARVVSGFRGAEWNEGDESYIVRASMAHLWVEALFPESGWVIFDPSPREDLTEQGAWRGLVSRLSAFRLKAEMMWYQEVISFDSSLQFERLRDFSMQLFQMFAGQQETPDDTGGGFRQFRIPLLPILLLVATLTGLALLSRILRHRGDRLLTADQARAIRLLRRIRRHLRRHGIACAGKTAEELRLEGAGISEVDAGLVAEALSAYNDARFGRRALPPVRYKGLLRRLRASGAAPAKAGR